MSADNTEENTVVPYEPDYEQMAQDFMRGKLEGLYAKAHKTPNPKQANRLKTRIEEFDPTIFSNRKFIKPTKPQAPINLKKGFMF